MTLFEKAEHLGGIVRYVIPSFRIPDETIERDVALLKKMGVTIKTGTTAPGVEELKEQGFADVILAIGAYAPGSVRLEAGKSINVLEFLAKFRAGEKQDLGKNVAIIGGGNTAMDAARAAKRADGVENSYIVYRRTKRYMPADEEELQFAIDDGVKFIELVAPKSLENGKLTCTVMQLGAPDASGRRSPVPTDETMVLDVDTVIAAVGEKVEKDVLEANGIQISGRGRALVDGDLMTSNPDVYIIGDAQRGPATIVEAIADARKATDAILNKRIHNTYIADDGKEREKKGVLVTAAQAENEAQRCLECNVICENCVDVCPNRANISINVHGALQIVHVDRLCNECGNCETFCPYNSAPYKDKFTLFSTQEDFNNSDNEGFWPQSDGRYLVRLDRSEFVSDGSGLPAGLAELMEAVTKQCAYFVGK